MTPCGDRIGWAEDVHLGDVHAHQNKASHAGHQVLMVVLRDVDEVRAEAERLHAPCGDHERRVAQTPDRVRDHDP